jgi:hypothetical protein
MERDPAKYIPRHLGPHPVYERIDVIAVKVRALVPPSRADAKVTPPSWGFVPKDYPVTEGLDVARVAEYPDGRTILLPNMLTVALREESRWTPEEVAKAVAEGGFRVVRHLFGRVYTVQRVVRPHELTDVLADAAVLARVSEFADVEPVWLEHLGPREAQDGPPAG